MVDLANAQREHDIWNKFIYALESGDETNLPKLPIPFSQFYMSQDGVLCRYWPQKKDPVAQFVITESHVPKKVQSQLRESKADMNSQQHRHSSPVTTKVGDSVMVRVPERYSKLSPKFVGPRLVVKQINENKFELFDPWLNTLEVVHNNRLKKTSAKPDLTRWKVSNWTLLLVLALTAQTHKLTLLIPIIFVLETNTFLLLFVSDMRTYIFLFTISSILALDPAHLKPGALTAHLGRVSLVEDVLWVRYPYTALSKIPSRLILVSLYSVGTKTTLSS
ncbi:hypothetical protein E2C01_045156 [Portunus trituberculatus]|uniref:Uncharacterized protein n=1 Tax=Portunus trituberculatus TaxID=210409 RepID=A0A5B7FUZ6_PORTR|nr:hypothetical protein [Portunus trituberculatus]